MSEKSQKEYFEKSYNISNEFTQKLFMSSKY